MDAFPHPYNETWVEELARARGVGELDEDSASQVEDVENRHRKLADAYYAWLRLRAECLVLYPPHRSAIRTLAEALEAEGVIEPARAHAMIASVLGAGDGLR